MTKLIVVVGATGGQGGGVVNALLYNPDYRVRGITRNTNSDKSRALTAKGVKMVQADQKDEESRVRAFDGATAIFAVTDYYDFFFERGKDASIELEYLYWTNLAKAAAKTPTLETYIWSTLPDTSAITGGEAIVPHFKGKGQVDSFIKKSLPELYEKTTFGHLYDFCGQHASIFHLPPWLVGEF